MSHRTRRSRRARAAATAFVAALLSGGLLAPSAAAATPAPTQPTPGSLCGPHPTYGGFFCDGSDIAGALSGLLTPIFAVTCIDAEANVVICRVNEDNTPFGE